MQVRKTTCCAGLDIHSISSKGKPMAGSRRRYTSHASTSSFSATMTAPARSQPQPLPLAMGEDELMRDACPVDTTAVPTEPCHVQGDPGATTSCTATPPRRNKRKTPPPSRKLEEDCCTAEDCPIAQPSGARLLHATCQLRTEKPEPKQESYQPRREWASPPHSPG